ncbi:multidrug ABC transporter permease [Actinocatenispora thailandica]|uniref:Multidrug ABC transporter permease n=1 Tax=Actinocatenispora thailandica TaxID=227318 RepID=A0A7R7DN08_9ACTN|nr:ABC transporter ATP-binding protein [Actinocatenispora thailandica]BCJ34633.1 multidrug ABC transporter permease [Actinocatenispora thailandica]
MSGRPTESGLGPARACRYLRVALGLAVRAAPGGLAALVVLAVLAGLLPVATAWLLKLVLDGLVRHGLGGVLVWLGVLLALLGVARTVLPRAASYAKSQLGRATRLVAFDRLFTRVVSRLRGLARLEDPRFHDRLQLAQHNGSYAPSRVVTNAIGIGESVLTLGGFLGTLLVVNPWLAAALAVAVIPTARAELLLSRRRARAMLRIGHAERRQLFYAGLLSNPREAKEIRLFGLGPFFRDRMLRELRTANGTQQALDRRDLAVQAGLGLMGAVIAGGGLVWAIDAARHGRISVGDVSVFVAAVAGVQSGLSQIVQGLALTHQALLMLDHYQAVVTVQPDLPAPAEPSAVPALGHAIELRDVWFRYGPDRPWVLRGVDLTIPAGSSLALVGLNGAGKSTIVKLLCRLYDPSRGSIHWDGLDLRDLDPDRLRERIGAVFQDFVQYELPARENIGVGDLSVFDDSTRIERAARLAGIHETLAALPAGYDTPLTRMFQDNADRDDPETGVLLSGGQGQRLALARAFLRDRRDLLILDEPSAGLDADAEATVHARIREHRRHRTSLLISHRLNTVRDADRIVVLAGGRLAEQGDHASLIELGGEYARLFALQARGYAEPVRSAP